MTESHNITTLAPLMPEPVSACFFDSSGDTLDISGIEVPLGLSERCADMIGAHHIFLTISALS